MKLYIFSAFAVSALNFAAAQNNEDKVDECVDCLEDIDDARDCLRTCNNNRYNSNQNGNNQNLLAECLDPSGDFGSIDSFDGLIDCCSTTNIVGGNNQFGKSCEDDLEDVQECLEGCIDGCLVTDSQIYLDCIRDETGSGGCVLATCLNGFLSDDIEDDINLSGSEDIFDLRSIANRIERLESEEDFQTCEGALSDFVDTVCEIGDTCCDRCEAELGGVVDCLINEVVIPFVSLELNQTILSCPIDEENCELDSRSRSKRSRKLQGSEVTAEEAALFNKAVSLPKKKSSARKQAILEHMKSRKLEKTTEDLVAECESKMRMEIVSTNTTHATNNYMECITAASIMIMDDGDESAAAGVAKLIALVFAFGTALLF